MTITTLAAIALVAALLALLETLLPFRRVPTPSGRLRANLGMTAIASNPAML